MKVTLTAPTVSEQIVVFADLTGFHREICSKLSPEETFAFLSNYYATVQRVVDDSDGRIVKFIGDAILLLFPPTNPGHTIGVLRNLKVTIDTLLSQRHFDSRLCIKAHVGVVAMGAVGAGELERFDVCGVAVNQAALLPRGEWVLSDELQKRIKS